MGMFYGNKTAKPINDVITIVVYPGDLGTRLIVQPKQIDSDINAGAQVQQLINIECLMDFYKLPTL